MISSTGLVYALLVTSGGTKPAAMQSGSEHWLVLGAKGSKWRVISLQTSNATSGQCAMTSMEGRGRCNVPTVTHFLLAENVVGVACGRVWKY